MSQINGEKKNVDLITEELFREAYLYQETRKPPFKKVLAENLKCSRDTFLNLFPIAKWMQKYSLKKDLVNDLVAGVTVAIMHVPHGLAYAPLGRVEPVVGFYMAIFPVFVYMFMGTSRHISIGTFAVVCAMVGYTVGKYELPVFDDSANSTHINVTTEGKYPAAEVGAAVCLIVGLWQALLGLLRLGFLTVLMSESMVSGFTTGAAFHVFSYQMKNLFGVQVASFSGVFKLAYIYIDFFSKISTINFVTTSISAACITILFFFILYVKPLLDRKYPQNKIPIPIELIVVVVGILISYFAELSKNYQVKIVGYIPVGFPEPMLPPVSLLPNLVIDSFVVAVVAIAINVSMAKIFAKKNDYEVYNNQELIAYGAANIFAAFFRCLPSAASLSRSSVQFSVGGKTQLASLFSIIIIMFILLVAGSLFEPVPYCVLSSIVIVSLKSLLMQVMDLPKIWRQSYLDGIVWLGTFLAVVVLDLGIGLGVGVTLSLISMIISSERIQVTVLGRVPNTNIFLDMNHYKAAQPTPGVLVLQITGNVNFANSSNVENKILKEYKTFFASISEEQSYVVISMSSVSRIDPTCVTMLKHIHKDLKKLKCQMYLTDCNLKVFKAFETCKFFEDFPKDQVAATVADAVDYLNSVS